MLDWLTDNKLPLGKISKTAFDWMKANLSPLFDAMGMVMEALIDAILWVLQTPHPLVIIAAFLGLTWYLQRSWKILVFVALIRTLSGLEFAACRVCRPACAALLAPTPTALRPEGRSPAAPRASPGQGPCE